MEKHKPYKCNTCGKRYKNLNGLKYHKNHSTDCEDSKQQLHSPKVPANAPPHPSSMLEEQKFPRGGFGAGTTTGIGMGIPMNTNPSNGCTGAALPGIDEEMIM